MKNVRVLLSAYNGEKYLKEQLDSILSQQGVHVSLLVRDDGSCDRTWEILAAYARRYENVSVYAGENKGAAGSFYDLLARTDAGADYYAFADQDDVWYAEKLKQAVRKLERETAGQKAAAHGLCTLPLLYAGKVICASEDLGHQEMFSYRVSRKASFGNALVENICMGCTEVFNRSLLLLVRGHLPHGQAMHDWWMYLTAAYFGKVVYDQNAYMLYRQHGKNEVGMQNRWGLRWKNRTARFRQMRHKLSSQAAEFQEAYAGLLAAQDEDAGRLELICGYRDSFYKRACLVFGRAIYRQNRLDGLVFRLLAAAGYL